MAQHPWWVIVLWVVATGLGFASTSGVFGNEPLRDRLESGEIIVDGPNQDGREVLEDAGTSGYRTYSLIVEDVDIADPEVAERGASAVQELTGIDHVSLALNPYVVPTGLSSPEALAFIGDGDPASRKFVTVVTYDEDVTDEEEEAARAEVNEVFDALVADLDAESKRGGLSVLVDAVLDQLKEDLELSEFVSLPISFLVMIVVFGGFVAAGLPIFGAVASIAGGLVSLLGWSHLIKLDQTTPNVVVFLGLALCIDYGLLMVSRFREEMRQLLQGADRSTITRETVAIATGNTLDRAGRTVFFSGLTVAISLLGLMVFDIELIRGISAAGVSVVAVAILVGLMLIPALCVVSAKRLLKRGTEVAADDGVFSQLATFVHRFPWLIIVVVSGVLLVMAAPALNLKIISSGPELIPVGSEERTFFEDFREDFPQLNGAEVIIVTKAPAEEVTAWATEAADLPGVESVDQLRELDDGVRALGLRTGDFGQGDKTRELVDELYANGPPFDGWVVSASAGLKDFEAAVSSRVWWAVGLVMLTTLVLLFLATGSIIIPIKAIFMNVLSLGAALGAMVWIFQDGNGEELLNFSSVGAIENTVPLLVLAFGFGLSMDYEVFLLSRIVELHEQGHDNRSAVTLGLQRSGRIITSAALIMVIVFSSTAAAKMLVMKELGLALVIAIIVDATLVRMLLVPATMAVLGNLNWWAPAPLKRLHATWGIRD